MENDVMAPRGLYRKCSSQKERLDLYQERYSLAQDIFTGQPLTGDSLKDWKALKLRQEMTKRHVKR